MSNFRSGSKNMQLQRWGRNAIHNYATNGWKSGNQRKIIPGSNRFLFMKLTLSLSFLKKFNAWFSIFDQHSNFCRKFWPKIFDKKFVVLKCLIKISLLTKMSIFDQNLGVRSQFQFSTKNSISINILIIDKILDFRLG